MKYILIVLFFYSIKIVFYLIFFAKKKTQETSFSLPKEANKPLLVDIILPMCNEEKVIFNTITSLSKISYLEMNIIAVDDGSIDRTCEILEENKYKFPNLQIISQPNQGKSAALNNGICNSKADIVVCLDADTVVNKNIIDVLVGGFTNDNVAAVAGNLRVSNVTNLLTYVQDIEYIIVSNFEREVFSPINGIVVVPGAVGAFRRQTINQLGGYNTLALTEDLDIVAKLVNNGFKINNAKEAIGYTEAPASISMYLKQRVRWKIGLLQILNEYYKNKNVRKDRGLFFKTAFPYMYLFRIILPIFTPIMDYLFIYSIFTFNYSTMIAYGLFVIIDSLICVHILIKDKSYRYIPALPIQRFLTRQLGLLIYLKILYKALKGTLFDWGRSVRYGNITVKK